MRDSMKDSIRALLITMQEEIKTNVTEPKKLAHLNNKIHALLNKLDAAKSSLVQLEEVLLNSNEGDILIFTDGIGVVTKESDGVGINAILGNKVPVDYSVATLRELKEAHRDCKDEYESFVDSMKARWHN